MHLLSGPYSLLGPISNKLREVFLRFRSANLKLKPSKCNLCKFFQKEAAFLWHIATDFGTRCDPQETEVIQTWPQPKNAHEIMSFLGLVNFYRAFIQGCAEIAHPLTHLTKKKVKFKSDDACQKSFENLKECLMAFPVLANPTCNGVCVRNRGFLTRHMTYFITRAGRSRESNRVCEQNTK